MSDIYHGVGVRCPRCEDHYYLGLASDDRPMAFTCPTCGWSGTVRWAVDDPRPIFTAKEATDDHRQDPQ